MASYATADDLTAYLAGGDVDAPGDSVAREALLTRSERRVDALVGPRPLLPSGLKFDPSELTPAQRSALSRATCAAAEHELVLGRASLVGGPEALPGDFTVFFRGSRQPVRALEELAGTSLVTASGTVAAA